MVPIRSHLAAARSALSLGQWVRTVPHQQALDYIPKGCSKKDPAGIGQRLRCIARPGRPVWLWFLLALMLAEVVPARAADLAARFDEFLNAQTNVQSWCAEFTQTRSLKVLAQPLVSTGRVWVAVPGQFRWELGQPPQTIAIRQPEQLLILYPRLKRAEKYPLEGVPPGPLKDALALLDASLPRDRASMEARFKLLSAAETNATLQVRLEPKSASARKFIGEILIGFRTNDFAIALTELKFADGSSLRNDFTNTVVNQPIPPGLFAPRIPADYTVVEPLRK